MSGARPFSLPAFRDLVRDLVGETGGHERLAAFLEVPDELRREAWAELGRVTRVLQEDE